MIFRSSSRFRLWHRALAPIMVLPLLLTTITGVFYQLSDLTGVELDWLLEMHKGNFGLLKLEVIYPFLNGLGLIGLLFTGMMIWLRIKFL